jgi:fatty-acyl-CoA synthase
VQDERCTSLYGVPTMFIAELEHPSFGRYRLDSLRTGIMAGAPCPIEIMRQVIERMHMSEVTICYGMTETSPVSFQSEVTDDLETRVSTIGSILPQLECKIIDPATGAVVPRGEPGELCTRGYSVMLGYWDDAPSTAAAIDEARWMHSGDLAVMREDGYAKISGRLKDMIIRGGENIYPREIDEVLYKHPKIRDAATIGVKSAIYGEDVKSFVVRKDGSDLTADEVVRWCKQHLADYKCPKAVAFVDEIPKGPSGKLLRRALRAMDEKGV